MESFSDSWTSTLEMTTVVSSYSLATYLVVMDWGKLFLSNHNASHCAVSFRMYYISSASSASANKFVSVVDSRADHLLAVGGPTGSSSTTCNFVRCAMDDLFSAVWGCPAIRLAQAVVIKSHFVEWLSKAEQSPTTVTLTFDGVTIDREVDLTGVITDDVTFLANVVAPEMSLFETQVCEISAKAYTSGFKMHVLLMILLLS